jgi:hypothetical protein
MVWYIRSAVELDLDNIVMLWRAGLTRVNTQIIVCFINECVKGFRNRYQTYRKVVNFVGSNFSQSFFLRMHTIIHCTNHTYFTDSNLSTNIRPLKNFQLYGTTMCLS